MLFRRYIPRTPLHAFVEDFWLYQDYAGDHLRERILPSGTFELVFNLQEDELRIYGSSDRQYRRFSGALVSGPYAGSFMSDTAEEAAIIGVHFKPGGAATVLGLPADELVNAHVDLSAIWGSAATALWEQLCALREPAARFRLLEHFLLERMSTARRHRHGAVRIGLDALIRNHGRATVHELARAVDLSQRRFIELFAGEVGLTPKLFGRVQRFQHAVASLRHSATVDWAEFAVACGYFDQSHLIHEFVAFSGSTPVDYLRRQGRLERAAVHVKRHHLPLVA